MTEWGCMQALIDFEGWRKWRGFADISQLSTSTDPVTSPMRVGQHGHLEKPERDSSSESHSTPRPDGVNESKEGPNPPRPTDAIAREDSSGSGSGSADTLDSPAKY